MVVDPANVAAQNASSREQRLPTIERSDEPVSSESRSDTSQTSDAGPAVVTTLSAAALETSRPVTPSEQPADQNRTRAVLEGEDRAARNQTTRGSGEESGRESRVDVVI